MKFVVGANHCWKGEIAGYIFPQKFSKDPFKLEQFADDIFKFDENCSMFSKMVENTVGKEEIDRYEQFLLFPQCFRKTCTADT